MRYTRPELTALGSVHALTQQTPPGKTGQAHDASQFVNNSVPANAYPGGSENGPNPS